MMDRRTTLKWMLAASATVPALGNFVVKSDKAPKEKK